MSRRVLIIGGGPAGYVAAQRASALGAEVTLVERDALGGTCLNRGCIPTKALLESVKVLDTVQRAGRFGVAVSGIAVDFPTFYGRKDQVVRTLRGGLAGLMRRAGVNVLAGTAQLVDRRNALVRLPDGTAQEIGFDAAILATGSAPATLPVPGIDSGVLNSDSALALTEMPSSIAIVGAGAIGLEWATIFRGLGAHVTLIEALSRPAATEDEELGLHLAGVLAAKGVEVLCDAMLRSVSRIDVGYRSELTVGGRPHVVETEQLMLAVGRKPITASLGLETAGVRVDPKGFILVDEQMQTSVPDIYAAGDVVGGPLLAHIAFAEGTVAAENAMGHVSRMSYRVVPRCIFCDPEVAAVGITEAEAKARGYDVRVGRFTFAGIGKAIAMGDSDGFVKVVADAAFGEVLGVHIVGPHATDLLGEAAVALHMEATAEELGWAVHGHPTLAEAIKEASLDVMGMAFHK